MKLSVQGFALASALLWGGSILFVGIIELFVPGYGHVFLNLCDSIYPGFDNSHTVVSVLSGTGYGLVDGAVFGLLFAWFYNLATGYFTGR